MEPRTYPTRVRAALACKIVNLDRVRFNDAVANKLYPCAPPTMAGSARLFFEKDLLPLFFFARLSEFGIAASVAGEMACEMASVANSDYASPATRITYVRGTMAGHYFASKTQQGNGEIHSPYDPEHQANGTHYPGIGTVLFTIDFYISHVRKIIADAIARERSILGDDD